LELHSEKTRIIEFGRFAAQSRTRQRWAKGGKRSSKTFTLNSANASTIRMSDKHKAKLAAVETAEKCEFQIDEHHFTLPQQVLLRSGVAI
jgi:hypothetical protein